MGAKLVTVTVINKTSDTWHFTPQSREFIRIGGRCSTSYQEDYNRNCHIRFRHENRTAESFEYEFDTTHKIYWYNITFIIRETQDPSQIELHCVNDGGSIYCKITEDERRDEDTDVEEKFKELLLKYQITEDKEIQHHQILDRIMKRQNELVDQYCRENNLSAESRFTFDQDKRYNELSLAEKLTVLEASLQFKPHSRTEDANDEEDQLLGWEKKYDFLLGLMEQLHVTNPTVAKQILLSLLDTISELSPQSREILGEILFNRIWTPTEIMLFIFKSSAIKCDQLDSVLDTAQTYHLDYKLVLSALTTENPLMFLQEKTAQRNSCCCCRKCFDTWSQ